MDQREIWCACSVYLTCFGLCCMYMLVWCIVDVCLLLCIWCVVDVYLMCVVHTFNVDQLDICYGVDEYPMFQAYLTCSWCVSHAHLGANAPCTCSHVWLCPSVQIPPTFRCEESCKQSNGIYVFSNQASDSPGATPHHMQLSSHTPHVSKLLIS